MCQTVVACRDTAATETQLFTISRCARPQQRYVEGMIRRREDVIILHDLPPHNNDGQHDRASLAPRCTHERAHTSKTSVS
jgi:hypothetical protein